MRVLIATVSVGAGHRQAAAALEESWLRLRPLDEVETIDLLDYVPTLQRKVYSKTYLRLVEHAPELWGMIFNKTDNPSLVRKLARYRRAWAKHTNTRFAEHLVKSSPDVLICVHYLPLGVLAHLQDTPGSRKPFTVSVITDFEAHALWMETCVDLYCVAAEATKARLLARGVPPENAVVTGIPIAAGFAGPIDAAEVRKRQGLRDDLPVILVLGGGFGLGPIGEILRRIDQVRRPMQIVVVAGQNKELRAEIAREDREHPTHVVGFVHNMHEWMAAADLIVSKPGGLTSSEALALGKPLLIINPIPGQEAANSDFLLQHGTAVKVNHLDDLVYRLDQILSADQLTEVARAAKALGRPCAAEEVCRAIVMRCGEIS